MRKKILKYLFILIVVFLSTNQISHAQTYTISNDVHWSTSNQNMWGPNGSPFSIDTIINLFNVDFDTIVTAGFMDTILGQPVGAEFIIDTWFEIGSTFYMLGFTTGSIDVDYPAQIDVTFPNNNTWNPGEIVTVSSDYTVLPGWKLESTFPQGGEIGLNLDFGFGLNMDSYVCLGGCDTFNIIDINVPLDTIDLFYINAQTGEVIYPCFSNGSFGFCHDTILPIVFNFPGLGLQGEITIPCVETHDWLDTSDPCHQTIYAQGDSTYLWLDLDIIQFLSAIAGVLPPPQGPAIQQFLNNLSGTYNFGGGITVDYTLLDAHMGLSSTMQQDLTFSPTVWTTLDFPTPVEYVVNDPTNGYAAIDSGFSDTISFPTCSDLNFKWPCFNHPSMDVGIGHSISSGFTNHTWDSIAFTFIISALEFTINVPFPIKTMPEIEIPEICLPSKDTSNKSVSEICMPAITHPEIDSLKINHLKNGFKWTIHIGPLYQDSIPLGYIPLTWYNNTWNLGGFHDTIVQGTTMIPNPEMNITNITGTDVLCFGDSSGSVTVTVEYGTPPYTYDWSNGTSNTTAATTDTMHNATSGTYYVTVSDVNGCSLTEQFTLYDINPPIDINLIGSNVLCHGDSTGLITAQVSGGTAPYDYLWSPMGGTSPVADSLPAGIYYLSITDSIGCPEVDSIEITEPDSAINAYIDTSGHVQCFGGSDGFIDLYVEGGTIPYYYQWSNGASSQDLSNIPADDYIVTITDDNACTFIVNHTITEPPLLETTISGTNITCYGFNNGTIDLTPSGGTTPYQYIWNTNASTQDLNNLSAGTYSVTVTDDHNCTTSNSITLTEPAAPLSSTIAPTHVLCKGDYTGAINLEVMGGTTPYSYNWSNNDNTEDLSGIPAGSYIVTITDLNGCILIDSIEIIEPANELGLNIISNDINCFGETTGTAEAIVSGGTSPYSYLWSNGNNNSEITNLGSGYYTVTVTDDHACTISETVFIDEPSKLVASTDINTTICIGDTATVKGAATGGTPPYTYIWNNGVTDSIFDVTPTITTQYTLHVIDSRGCVSNYCTFTVYVNPPLSIDLVADDYTVCPGDPVVLDPNAAGGDGNYQYLYQDSIIITSPITIYPDHTGSYSITLMDGCGTPSVTDNVSLEIMSIPPNSFLPDKTEGCAPLRVKFNENNPDYGQTYYWTFGDINSNNHSTKKNPVHIYNDAGSYDVTLTVSDGTECSNTNTISNLITVHPRPVAKFNPKPKIMDIVDPVVYFDNLSIDANAYRWYFGDGDSSHYFEPEHVYPQIPSTYSVMLIADNGFKCPDTSIHTVSVQGEYTFYAPTGFTPDGDNINEIFYVKGTGIDKDNFLLNVYDRWGELIFSTTDIDQGWDGSVKGKGIAMKGVYTWVAIFKEDNGREHTHSGIVTLIR